MERNPLLDTYLRQLRLPTFLKLYSQFATDAARNNQDAVRFLLALAEQEVNQRQHNMLQQRLKSPDLGSGAWRIYSAETRFNFYWKSGTGQNSSSDRIGNRGLSSGTPGALLDGGWLGE
jgi:hypothetical protein